MGYPIITVSRQYGSAGRDVARKVPEELKIPYYDKEVISMTAAQTGFSEEVVRNEERKRSVLSNPLFSLTQMIDVQVFMTQSEIIQQLAVQPCVIVGRCADYVLRDKEILSVFINAPLRDRIERVKTFYNRKERDIRALVPVAGQEVQAWLPLPAACPQQSNIELLDCTPGGVAAPEYAPQRTMWWKTNGVGEFSVTYRYLFRAEYTAPMSLSLELAQPDFDLEEQPPHIVFTPYLRALAAQLTEGITSPAEKAKRIYDYVTLNVRYHFQPSYFVHESIAENCARSRRGDCGIMALTFITLCRIAGIPARWESGFAVAPGDAGCHDWARFYVAPKGWMYADCSYGASMARRGDEVLRRHYFGSLDTGRMVANSAFEAPFDPPMLGFRSDPYDNQSGEMEADGVGLYGDDTVTTKEVLKFEEVE